MSLSYRTHRSWDGEQVLRRIGLLAGAILVSAALFSVITASASAKEQKGFFLAGEKSEEATKQPKFEGESYPTYLFGSEETVHTWGFQGTTLKCPEVDFSGKLSAATSELSLTTFYYYPACGFSTGGVLTIRANGCEDNLNVLNSGPPYVAQFALKCPAGQSYEYVQNFASQTCTYVIAPQTAVNTVNLANKGEGKKRGVQVVFNLSGVKYSIKSSSKFLPCAPNAGAYENGTYTGTILLNGYNEP
jgi:hypothetical protein